MKPIALQMFGSKKIKMQLQLKWILKKFDELTATELYSIIQLRNEVFVVEQNCVYQDADDKDQLSMHLCGWGGNKLVAYTRIIPQGISYTQASIGRVVTSPAYRKTGAGRQLMNQDQPAPPALGRRWMRRTRGVGRRPGSWHRYVTAVAPV